LPKRTIDGYLTGLERGHGMAVDPVNNEVAATSDLASAVYIYSRTANGNVKPLRKLQGDKTQLLYPEGVFIDTVNNEIAINNAGDKSVLFFSRTANGNVPPLRVIKGQTTGIVQSWGAWVDTEKNEYWTINASPFMKDIKDLSEYERLNSPAILVYPRLANGDVAPIRRIYGNKAMLENPFTYTFDKKNYEIMITSFSIEPGKDVRSPHTIEGFVSVYDMRLSGNVAPKRVLRTNAFNLPAGIFVSPEHDELGILEARDNMIMVFPRVW